MSFSMLILKNLLRRRWRSGLTIIGIAVGIGAMVALTSIAWGFERSWLDVYRERGTDLIVTKQGSRSGIPATFSGEIKTELQALPHVQEATALLGDMFSIEDAPVTLVLGWELHSSLWNHLNLIQGHWPTEASTNNIVIGAITAEMLGKSLGDRIQIETEEFTVCGIFTSSALVENAGIIMPLSEMQILTERQGLVNFFEMRLDRDTTAAELERLRTLIKTKFKGLIAFSPGEVPQANAGIQIAKAMSLATSLIALVVGAIGVMNTLLMSVFERLQEIGILLALGWKPRQILRMILFESLSLSFAGGVIGCALGFVVVRFLLASPWIRGKITGEVPPLVLGTALLIALFLGMLGGIYPAWVGSRIPPVPALRHE